MKFFIREQNSNSPDEQQRRHQEDEGQNHAVGIINLGFNDFKYVYRNEYDNDELELVFYFCPLCGAKVSLKEMFPHHPVTKV